MRDINLELIFNVVGFKSYFMTLSVLLKTDIRIYCLFLYTLKRKMLIW